MLTGQNTDRTIAKNMEIMPVRPGIELRLTFFGLFAKVGNELVLVVGDDGTVRHHQSGVEVLVIDRVQSVDIEISGAVDQVIHCGTDRLFGVGRFCQG